MFGRRMPFGAVADEDLEQPQETRPVFFDPVEQLVNDIALEMKLESANNSGGVQFWAQLNGRLFETSIGSFSEEVVGFRDYLASNKDTYDYAVRFMIRIHSKVYAEEAINTIGKSFEALSIPLGIGDVTGISFSTLDAFSKILMFIAVNKPILGALVLTGPLKRGE
ncbi:hypothetical protein CF8_0217 [Aeromonas phage CF8]|nr:hypothetical protein CF8_0217 [Aeromonas phage CF8]